MYLNILNNLKKAIELYLRSESDLNQIIDELTSFLHLNLKVSESDKVFQQNLIFALVSQSPQAHSFDVSTFNSLQEWIYTCIQEKCVCSAVQSLLGDADVIAKFYTSSADESILKDLYICLSAFELHQSSLLSQISEQGYFKPLRQHKRTNSHPHFSVPSTSRSALALSGSTTITNNRRSLTPKRKRSTFRSWKSEPNIDVKLPTTLLRHRSKTFSDKFRGMPSTASVKLDDDEDVVDGLPVEIIQTDDIKIWQDVSFQRQTSEAKEIPQQQHHNHHTNNNTTTTIPNIGKHTSPITSFISSMFGSPMKSSGSYGDYSSMSSNEGGPRKVLSFLSTSEGEKIRSKRMFDDDEDEPTYGIEMTPDLDSNSNLTNFRAYRTARVNTKKDTDLEKENAHFNISEAIISAIEHVKWDNFEKSQGKHKATTSNETILKGLQATNNEHIIYADLDDNMTAEKIGLALISKFHDKSLQKYSNLKWLVSETDVPQGLLPMPKESNSRNPDDHMVHNSTRGTMYWAPPRQQVIFTDHEHENRKTVIQRQNFRCAGCGIRISPNYIKTFRYCHYSGKYHCTGCHRNQLSIIPAKVLKNWDFNSFEVSCFSYKLLQQIWTYPLFYLPDLNPLLYGKAKDLESARQRRMELKFVKDFITTCRFAEREQTIFNQMESYLASDPDTWSMTDFLQSKSRELQKSLATVIKTCEEHIISCLLCSARGFICEYCTKGDVFFPWQPKVTRCQECGQCYHTKCYGQSCDTCLKCLRMIVRDLEKRYRCS